MPMTNRDTKTEKTEVDLQCRDGITFRGHLYIDGMKRVNDLLNDERAFIPFMDISGKIRLINKNMIISVLPSDQENGGRGDKSIHTYAA